MEEQLLLPPEAFGLPAKFTGWRTNQDKSILKSIDSPYRFVVQVMSTGAGKSLSYVTASILRGGRAVILTSTKGLQSQLLKDFKSIGMVDIRGRNSYPCNLEHDGTTCDQGPCIAGIQCQLQTAGGCAYYDQLRKAQNADLVITNYAYWMNQNRYGGGLGPNITTLVCDEAHDAMDTVSNFLTVSLDRNDDMVSTILPKRLSGMTRVEWKKWASRSISPVEAEVEIMQKSVSAGGNKSMRRRFAQLSRLKTNLTILRGMTDEWIWDVQKEVVDFCPVWPANYCERFLFVEIPKVILTSASLCDKTMGTLGIKSGEYEKVEYPHPFPREGRKLVWIPTVRMNYKTSQMELKTWMMRINQILRARQDRKGIIHTVSYKRRDMVMENSKFFNSMLTHKSRTTDDIVQLFKRSEARPLYLTSPSVTTGYDFPYDDCRFQIIGKIAYPDSTSRIVKARSKTDRNYNAYVAMQQLVQTVGRGTRAEDDWCENLIIDDGIGGFMYRHGGFAPAWFKDAVVLNNQTVPIPPPLDTRDSVNVNL